MIETMGVVLLTLLLQATVFLGLAWVAERLGWVRRAAAREFLWRSAVLGSVAAALLQLGMAGMQAAGGAGPWLRVDLDMRGDAPAVAAEAVAAPVRVKEQSRPAKPLAASNARRTDTKPASTAQSALPQAAATQSDYSLRHWVLQALPWLLLAWLLASLWHWLKLALAARALARLQSQALLLEAQDWQDDAATLARGFASAVPELKVSAQIGSPLATPGGCVLLPVWALALAADQRRALLAHELSHLCRRDPQWRVALGLWRGLLWPLPLAALAQQRLEALAELECDAAAARALGDGRPLAECLAQCLEQRLDTQFPAFAVAMAAPRSPLLQRAERLLEGVSMSPFHVPRRARLLALAAVIAASLALPAFVVQATVAAETASLREGSDDSGGCRVLIGNCTSVHSHNGATTITYATTGRRMQYKSNGEVRFNAQENGVEFLSAGGWVSIEEAIGSKTRKIEYRNGSGGLEVTYSRDGKSQPLDAEGQAWLAGFLPQMLREAAIDVPGRVARLYQEGGAKAVIAMVAQIKSDYARGRHLSELLGKHKLSASEVDLALEQTALIGSDYEKRQVLSATLDSQQIAPEHLAKVLQAAADIGSDYERAQLLVQAAVRVGNDTTLRQAWLKAADGVGSDYERRRALEALLAKTDGDAALLEILAAGDDIGSDFEHRELLTKVAAKARDVESIAASYAKAVGTIGSDFERREALLALVRGGPLQRGGALAVLDAAADIGSDFECRTVLVELVRVMPEDAQVRSRLIEVASKLSDFEREQVEEAAGLARG